MGQKCLKNTDRRACFVHKNAERYPGLVVRTPQNKYSSASTLAMLRAHAIPEAQIELQIARNVLICLP